MKRKEKSLIKILYAKPEYNLILRLSITDVKPSLTRRLAGGDWQTRQGLGMMEKTFSGPFC